MLIKNIYLLFAKFMLFYNWEKIRIKKLCEKENSTMKSQLKKIIPCIMAGVAGISYGKPIDNSNSEMNGISTATEDENVA